MVFSAIKESDRTHGGYISYADILESMKLIDPLNPLSPRKLGGLLKAY